MRLAGFNLYRYKLPLTAPLSLGGEALRHREGLLLELAGEGGAVGWGETSPLPRFSPDGLYEAAGQLRELVASVVGRTVEAGDLGPEAPLARELDRLDPAPSARFGLELALCNLRVAVYGGSLPELLAPRPATTVESSALLSGPPDRVLEEARLVREAGYGAVKLKVGGRPVEKDLDTVHAVYEALGGEASLRLDANRAWSFEEAERFADGVAGLRLAYIEEPLAEPSGLSSLARRCGLSIALDESLLGMPPERLEEHAYARAVVLKPTLLGGIAPALRLARRARELGMQAVVSSAYETGVGTAALVALAAGIGEAPAGLDTYRRLAGDVLRPRLALPASRIDVRAMMRTRREVERRWLSPVG